VTQGTGAAMDAAGASLLVSDPLREGRPTVSTWSFTVTGMPSSSPQGAPRAQRAAEARAAARAPSASTNRNTPSGAARRAMRANAASVTSTGESVPLM